MLNFIPVDTIYGSAGHNSKCQPFSKVSQLPIRRLLERETFVSIHWIKMSNEVS